MSANKGGVTVGSSRFISRHLICESLKESSTLINKPRIIDNFLL